MGGRLARRDRKAGGRLGRGGGDSHGSASRPDTRLLSSETSGGRRRNRKGSELAILEGTGSGAQTGSPRPSAGSGHQRAPSVRGRASPLLGVVPAMTGMESLSGCPRPLPSLFLPVRREGRPLPPSPTVASSARGPSPATRPSSGRVVERGSLVGVTWWLPRRPDIRTAASLPPPGSFLGTVQPVSRLV